MSTVSLLIQYGMEEGMRDEPGVMMEGWPALIAFLLVLVAFTVAIVLLVRRRR